MYAIMKEKIVNKIKWKIRWSEINKAVTRFCAKFVIFVFICTIIDYAFGTYLMYGICDFLEELLLGWDKAADVVVSAMIIKVAYDTLKMTKQ